MFPEYSLQNKLHDTGLGSLNSQVMLKVTNAGTSWNTNFSGFFKVLQGEDKKDFVE